MTHEVPALVGIHPRISRIRQRLPSLAAPRGPLLILGDAGVGKTLVARLIHEQSPFAPASMHLLDFELLSDRDARFDTFGAESPEVSSQRKGALEVETTVLLKNVHRAARYLQAILAKSLSAGMLRRSPEGKPHAVRCRAILTCTVAAMKGPKVIDRGLREFLARLPRISLPPLADRPDDLPLLVEHFHAECSGLPRFCAPAPAFDMDFLSKQVWPENVTSLKAFVRASLLDPREETLQQKEILEVEKMLMCIEESKQFSLARSIREIENLIVGRVLRRMNLHRRNAARLLGITDANVRGRLSLKGA
jgi:DNA-binding NtrC family response regulator